MNYKINTNFFYFVLKNPARFKLYKDRKYWKGILFINGFINIYPNYVFNSILVLFAENKDLINLIVPFIKYLINSEYIWWNKKNLEKKQKFEIVINILLLNVSNSIIATYEYSKKRKIDFWNKNNLENLKNDYEKQEKENIENYKEKGDFPKQIIFSFLDHFKELNPENGKFITDKGEEYVFSTRNLRTYVNYMKKELQKDLNNPKLIKLNKAIFDIFDFYAKNIIKIEKKEGKDIDKPIYEDSLEDFINQFHTDHKKNVEDIKNGVDRKNDFFTLFHLPLFKKFHNKNNQNISNKESQKKSSQSTKNTSSKEELNQIKNESFGFKEKSTERFSNIVKSLILKINFINESKTSIDNFIKVMTSNDLSNINTEIHFGCETTQLIYILDKLKIHFFSSLSYAKIERANLFFTSEGNLLTAGNLSASKIDNPKEKDEIDKIFNTFNR